MDIAVAKMNKNSIICWYVFLFLVTISYALAQTTCSDSDGGLDYYTKGHFVGFNKWGDAFDRWDFCQNNYLLLENSCDADGYLADMVYDCSSEGKICSDGMCVQGQVDSCTDTDPNRDIGIKGTVHNMVAGKMMMAEDSCSLAPSSPNLLYEWYCDGLVAKSEQVNCEELGGICYDGACVSCIDSDHGMNYEIYGSAKIQQGELFDICISQTTLREWYCDGNGMAQFQEISCSDMGLICSDGRCISNSCQDDEPQKDIAVRGRVTLADGTVQEDYCGYLSGLENVLFEVYCRGPDIAYDAIDCAEQGLKCINGKCIEESQIACTDTDPDNDISQRGVITIAGDINTQDECFSTDGLWQADCDGDKSATYEEYICSKEGKYCSEGVCVSCPEGTIFVYQIMETISASTLLQAML
jgi:hypothetical protein